MLRGRRFWISQSGSCNSGLKMSQHSACVLLCSVFYVFILLFINEHVKSMLEMIKTGSGQKMDICSWSKMFALLFVLYMYFYQPLNQTNGLHCFFIFFLF